MPLSQRVAHLRSLTANAVLRGDHEAADQHRRDLRAEMLGEHAERAVAAVPPLIPEQRETIIRILRPAVRAVQARESAKVNDDRRRSA